MFRSITGFDCERFVGESRTRRDRFVDVNGTVWVVTVHNENKVLDSQLDRAQDPSKERFIRKLIRNLGLVRRGALRNADDPRTP